MRRNLASLLMAMSVTACGGTQTPTASAPPPASPGSVVPSVGTLAPRASAQAVKPTMACLGGVAQATCDQVAVVALSAVAPSGWTPTQVWINSGFFCPAQNCLFDPKQNFPYPSPPRGGQWVANAEIAFAETNEHAGLHIAAVGAGLVSVLIGYRVPLSGWCSGSCPSSFATDGRFRLDLVLPRLAWNASEAITGMAILSLTDSAATTIYGSGEGVIAFSFDEVGGTRHAGWAMTADCGPHPLDPATPLNATLSKSGGVTGTEPDADFVRSFYADPQIRLPAGTWDITAIAWFAETAGCAGELTIKATVRIIVTG